MPSKLPPKQKYKQRALRFLDKSTKSFRNMTRQYERLGRIQDYLRQHPDDAIVRVKFEAMKKTFLKSNRVRDRLQQAAVAYGNYLNEPGAEPIKIPIRDLKRATRGYYGIPQLENKATTHPPKRLAGPKPVSAQPDKKPSATPTRLETMVRAQFNELRNTSEGGSLVAGPLLRYLQEPISARALASLHERLKQINRLLNNGKIGEAVERFQQTNDAISMHQRKQKKTTPSAQKPAAKEREARPSRFKTKVKKIWERMKSPFSTRNRVGKKSPNEALTIVYKKIQPKVKGSMTLFRDSIAVLRNVLNNSAIDPEQKKKIPSAILAAATHIDRNEHLKAKDLLESAAKEVRPLVKRNYIRAIE
ncbi:MAG: hypothetical protein IPJ89_04410 [Candidatus Iainarchaeum archaeon]|uniref:Uncharacterized protein n=1 Tax=Candidatus Iainarchaeum sp. TaxID=3101447 RepID=A0A7T9DJA8_9ARCH|nr:MAG: hypothetical protein IPJ89_04410 [Candidatus Diapherotrites archaeon]